MNALRLNEIKITNENTFNRDHFGIKGNHKWDISKKPCFGCFCRSVIRALTIVYRDIWLRNTYYTFCYSANVLNIKPRGFDRVQYYLIHIEMQ